MTVSFRSRRLLASLAALALVCAAVPSRAVAADAPAKSVDEQFAQLMKEQPDMRLFNEVAVLGQVNSPGKVKIGALTHLTLVDVIAKSGGTKAGADLRTVRIFRLNPDGVNESLSEDLSVRPGEKKRKFRMQPGDIVWVPTEK